MSRAPERCTGGGNGWADQGAAAGRDGGGANLAPAWIAPNAMGGTTAMRALHVALAFALSGWLVGIVSLNVWYREYRKNKSAAPAVNDLNVW